jgi:hypothetical protein
MGWRLGDALQGLAAEARGHFLGNGTIIEIEYMWGSPAKVVWISGESFMLDAGFREAISKDRLCTLQILRPDNYLLSFLNLLDNG